VKTLKKQGRHPGIYTEELQAQRARRRLQFGDSGYEFRRVRENTEPGSIGYQLVEQLQLFRRQVGR
jgi:hypothetical protein